NLSVSDVIFTLVAYTAFYFVMFVIAFYLMQKYAKKGPSQTFAEAEQALEEASLMNSETQGAQS
ncbi:MAG: cytochrome bd-I ubiquinol oxidase subunit CydA, partial [Paraglaciecola sp.]